MNSINLVKTAFRKLKAHAYFDKTALPLRDKIVEFESDKCFEDTLRAIAHEYDRKNLNKSLLIEEILSSICVLTFPKKMFSPNACNSSQQNNVISIGNPKEKPIIDELQYFIDMDIRGHILGVMWIMKFGKCIDEQNIESSRGNRLRKPLIWNEDGNLLDPPTPALFEPYFAQYSLWRDGGLSVAKELLAKKHDVIILTLDLKRFYYNTGITHEAFNKIKLEDNAKSEDTAKNNALHSSIFRILEQYTSVLDLHDIDHSGIVLPIGFLPSSVLSNWCLSRFDKGILDYWNPSYYGRYVDDIIIVEKIEKGSEIHNLSSNNKLEKDFVIDYYLGNGRRKATQVFASKATHTQIDNQQTQDENEKGLYKVNSTFCLSDESKFEFQSIKTRIITLYSDNNSTALIDKFKREIYENVSEFRLMPEVGEAFTQDDFSDFYRLENDATINKLRGVYNISMDKYELSKFLGRYRVVSGLVEDGRLKRKFTSVIGKMFNDRELIEHYILWERVFEIFVTDKDYAGFKKYAKRITNAIALLTIHTEENDNLSVDNAKGIKVKDSLNKHFDAAICRTLSLVWGENSNKIVDALYGKDTTEASHISIMRNYYLENHMSNKYVMSIPADAMHSAPKNIDHKDINLTEFSESFSYLCKDGINEDKYEYLPYFRQAQDIAISHFLRKICNDSCEDCKEQSCGKCLKSPDVGFESYINKIKKSVENAPIKYDEPQHFKIANKENGIIKVGEDKSEKLKVAIANVKVSDVANLESMLKTNKTNRKYSRYCALSDLVNMAIKEKADLLVLPENYVPFEWLSALASKSAREDLAIITGVEHITPGCSKNVYNFTAIILPFKYYNCIPTAAIFFQLKKHYSPYEKQLIEGYGYRLAKDSVSRPLYKWHDCYFPVYTCFELSAIGDRSEFMSWADMVVAVEYNRDTNYFGSIVESLTRDLHCYCVQVNTSEFGDSRISQPTKREEQNLISVKGGMNQALLIGEIDIQALREFQLKDYGLQKNGPFKPTPPGIDVKVIRYKLFGGSI